MWTSLCCFTACCKENECFWSDVDLVFDFDSPQRWSNQTEIHAHQCNSMHPHEFLDMLTQQCCYIDSVLTQILLPSQCCCSGCWSSAQSHVDWRPSHWRSHDLDKLLTVEAFWITPMFDFAQSCLPFLFVTGLTCDLHCNSIRFAFANKSLQRESNNIPTCLLQPRMSAWILKVTTEANTCKQHMIALNRCGQCTAGKDTYEGALTRQFIHCCSTLSSEELPQRCCDHSKSTCKWGRKGLQDCRCVHKFIQ